MKTLTKKEVKNVVHYARKLVEAWDRRNPEATWATLSEESAIAGLRHELKRVQR